MGFADGVQKISGKELLRKWGLSNLEIWRIHLSLDMSDLPNLLASKKWDAFGAPCAVPDSRTMSSIHDLLGLKIAAKGRWKAGQKIARLNILLYKMLGNIKKWLQKPNSKCTITVTKVYTYWHRIYFASLGFYPNKWYPKLATGILGHPFNLHWKSEKISD